MANVRVDLNFLIKDGSEVVFKAPCDCSAVTGLIVYYPGSDGGTASQVFQFADAHGNDVGNIDALFAADAVVKVILDTINSKAFVQNADTNAYLEARFENHSHAASTITAGTFAGQVAASADGQDPSTALLRNTAIVAADTDPTVNGQINWTYK